MFTKWYKLAHRSRILQNSISGFKAYDGTSFTYYGSNRSSRNLYEFALGYALERACPITTMINNGYPCVSFGSGTTEPTEEDYTLEAPLTSGVTFTPGTLQKSLTDEQDVMYNTFMITNTGTEDITVSEVGIFAKAAGSDTKSTDYYTLLERTVFDPVTIPAGESVTVKYEIVVNYPTV